MRFARSHRGEMGFDGWIRHGALAAIPATVFGMYLARRPPPARPAPSATVAPSVAEPAGLGPLSSAIAERGEAALAEGEAAATARHEAPPRVAPARPALAAAELPFAEPSERSRSTRPPSPRAGSCGGVEARLITASDDPAWAFASLTPAPGEPAVIRHPGERIGGYRVERIEWDRVWLVGAGSRCAATLNLGAREAEETRGSRRLPGDAPSREPWRVPGEIANAIEKRTETEYAIDRALWPAIHRGAGALLYGLEIQPVRRDEKVVALELGEIRTDSLLERLGVETGDRVLAIDGQPVTSLEAVVASLEECLERERIVAKLERKGESFELSVVSR
jgi:hypothetical protein